MSAALKTKALTAAAIAGLLRPMLADVNVVSAPSVAKERGMVIDEVTRAAEGDYDRLITLDGRNGQAERARSPARCSTTASRASSRSRASRPNAEFAPSMIYVSNEDKPGFIGRFASLLGEAGVNIATFALGRDAQGGSAIALVGIDGDVPDSVFAQILALPGVKQAEAMKF